MLIKKRDLLGMRDDINIDVDIKNIDVKDNRFLKRLEDNVGYISFYYDITDCIYIDYKIEGKMVCPDAYTDEDVYVDYSVEENLELVFDENKEGFYLYGDMELEELICYIVSPEAPIKVEKTEKKRYYSGDGWSCMSEEEYDKNKKSEIDPRLKKLMEYKEEK